MNMELVYKQLDELLQMGRIEETEDFLIAAMGRAQQEGDYNSLIALLNEMTGYQKETGKPDKAVAYGAQAIELMKQLGMTKTAVFGTTLLNVANACREAGKLPEAYQLYMEAFPVFENILHRMIPTMQVCIKIWDSYFRRRRSMSGQWNVWKRHLRLFRESRNIRNRPW